MTNGTVDTAVTTEAQRFFNFNYPIGKPDQDGTAAFGSKGFLPSVTGGPNATVIVKAETTLPTTLMRVVGFTTLPISATCNAKLDFVNTDIVLVLDTTGSMICLPTESSCNIDYERSGSKIVALRQAVLSFYDTIAPVQAQLAAAGLRLRIAVVPYSSSVNMGKVLRGINTNYIEDDAWLYQSRLARYRHSKTGDKKATCEARGVPGGYGVTSNRVGSQDNYTCTWTDEDPNGNNATFYGWSYKQLIHDVSGYVTGNPVLVPTRRPGSSTTSTWAGCIEEQTTDRAVTGTSTTIPYYAFDMNPDLIPNTGDIATRWRPYWPEVEYRRAYDYLDMSNYPYPDQLASDTVLRPQVACPAEGRRLQSWTRSQLSTYLNTLNADGGTYHDNGMLWANRLVSPNGVFSADNPTTYAGMPVSKYVIFMTDGALDTGYEGLYTTYGIEKWDNRVTPPNSDEDEQARRHLNRFGLLCTTAKNRGVSVWIVAFAQALTSSLTQCATNAAQASTSSNQAQLNAKFVEIGQNIGALRLTQ